MKQFDLDFIYKYTITTLFACIKCIVLSGLAVCNRNTRQDRACNGCVGDDQEPSPHTNVLNAWCHNAINCEFCISCERSSMKLRRIAQCNCQKRWCVCRFISRSGLDSNNVPCELQLSKRSPVMCSRISKKYQVPQMLYNGVTYCLQNPHTKIQPNAGAV